MKKILFYFLLLCYAAQVHAQHGSTVVREYKKVFTTYPFSDPDPVPKPTSKIYPYYRFDGFTDQPVQKEWKVVELENDYIKLMILPEIGGKIWSATEKSSGRDFIYHNHVVKFRDVAMRGPWTSGGIEANYGIVGHTPNCATPVDYTTIKRNDGSISCIIGVLDLLTRTSWRLDINLPVDKAYFTTNSFWFNGTGLEQPYYTWMNTGLKASGNLQFIYPGNRYLGHEGEYSDWPVNRENGRDISFYNNNDFGGYKSYHVFGKYTDFFGAYWHDDDFGMGRYSTRDDKPGKKIWIWGLSQQGMIWEKLLSDTDGQYVEVQSGRLFNQSAENSIYTPFKHRSFSPGQSDAWTEYWFPVGATGGFVQANNVGALNVTSEDGWLKLSFSPLQAFHAPLVVSNDSQVIFSRQIAARPMELLRDSIRTGIPLEKLQVSIGDNMLVWKGAPNAGDLRRPLKTAPGFDHNSTYGLYLQGKNFISFRDYETAAQKLTACLRKDSNYLPALTAMASLHLRNGNYQDALQSATRALSIDTYDPAANYYYGLANWHLGLITDAKDGFDIAAQSVEFRSAAYAQQALLYLREKIYPMALAYAEKSLLSNAENIQALQLKAVIMRLQQRQGNATAILDSLLAIDPLCHFAIFEKARQISGGTAGSQALKESIKNELPQQSFLELACWYHSIGLYDDALEVLQSAPVNAEIVYWKAWLKHRPDQLNNLEPGLDFPFRPETAEVLQDLVSKNNSWVLRYHLALIYWSRHDLRRAKDLFAQCGSQPGDPAFYAARSALYNDSIRSLADLRRAVQLAPGDARYAKLLAEHLLHHQKTLEAMEIADGFYHEHPGDYVMGMLYAKTLLARKMYGAADTLLTVLKILPFEGATEGRKLYHDAKMMQAVSAFKSGNYERVLQLTAGARMWPENLGAGRPYESDIDERPEDWLDYLSYSALGKKDSATRSLDRIDRFTKTLVSGAEARASRNDLISAWAIAERSSYEKAAAWLRDRGGKNAGNAAMQGAFNGFLQQPRGRQNRPAQLAALESLL